ncbi:MAG: hypothetical protein JNN00_15820 [Chitinophagaceae bacterium]|nr:hypothetical protein [Chitinophagaceae bacterium]
MLEQISELVKYYGQDAVVNNPDIPSENSKEVMAEAARTITSGMQNMLAGGGLQDIISMFTGRGAGNGQSNSIAGLLKNPMVIMMVGHLISKLTGKFNMNPSQASQVSNNLIPNVLKDLVARTNSNAPQDDAFDLNDLISSLTGGNAAVSDGSDGFNFQDLLGQLTGGSSGSSDGGFDLQDIIGQITRSAQENKARETRGADGGIADLIKGFFN